MANGDKPKRFRVEISDITEGNDKPEIVHAATVVMQDHAELAKYLHSTARLVDKHGD
jgi:uncharacterized protein YlxP (DUF503 family)